MSVDELEIIRHLQFAQISEAELIGIFQENRDSYRVLLHLVQHPRFPAHQALNVIPKLYVSDLLKVIRNGRANPFVRKRSELDFKIRFARLPLGEKVALMKTAPFSLLTLFVDENHKTVLETIFANPNCTEELMLQFINRKEDRQNVYEALDATSWHTSPALAEAVAHDTEAPIRTVLKIIPYAGLATLQKMVADDTCHPIVRQRILEYVRTRQVEPEE